MKFVRQCIEDSLPIWDSCLETEFLRDMAAGKLDTECLKGYIVEDSLYLREYAKVFGWGIVRAQNMEEIRTLYSLLAFVNEREDAARLRYLKEFGLTDSQIQTLPLRPENQAYVDTMIEAAKNGQGAAESMMACLPCMLSYSWIFRKLISAHPEAAETISGPLILEYASDGYAELCRDWAEFAEKICAEISEERRQKCGEVFRKCSEHEYQFWLMSARKRDDL